VIPNPYVILGTAGAWLASLLLCGWLMYARGHDDMRNAYTEQQLTQANRNLANAGKNNSIAHKADEQHQQGVQVVHDTTREIVRTVTIPPDADPLLPVWFVRLFDRFASRSITGDPYPGKSDGEPSDVRLSEARTMLGKWADDYYTCREQVIDTGKLNPVLPAPPEDKRNIFDKLNPF
jgi:hypothetical protein